MDDKNIPVDWLQSQANEAREAGEDRVARIIEALIKRWELSR